MKQLNMQIEDSQHDWLRRHAFETRESIAQIVRGLIDRAMKEVAPVHKYSVSQVEHPLDFCQVDPSANPVQPMEVYLEFDPQEGALSIDMRHTIDGTPMRAWHGIVRRYPVPARVNAVDLAEDINAGVCDHLLDAIRGGHTVEWDGSNHIGRLTQAAQDAELGLCALLEEYEDDSVGGLWDAGEWLYDIRHDLGITADTTDNELQALATKLEAEALDENTRLYSTMKALEAIRQELIDEREN